MKRIIEIAIYIICLLVCGGAILFCAYLSINNPYKKSVSQSEISYYTGSIEACYKANGTIHLIVSERDFTIDVAAVDNIDLLEQYVKEQREFRIGYLADINGDELSIITIDCEDFSFASIDSRLNVVRKNNVVCGIGITFFSILLICILIEFFRSVFVK